MPRSSSPKGPSSRGGARGRPLLRRLWPFRRRGNRRVGRAKPQKQAATSSRAAARRARRLRMWLSLMLRALAAVSISGAILLAGYGGCYLLYHSPHFAVKEVRVRGMHRVSEASLRARAVGEAGVLGANLFSVNLSEVRRALLAEPWLKSVTLRRELPTTLSVEVEEHVPAALMSLDALYLVDETGTAFKRAAPEEYDGLPVLTGIGRTAYQFEPELSQRNARFALSVLGRFRAQPGRPPIGEVHMDRFAGVTLYTEKGVAIRVGSVGSVGVGAGAGTGEGEKAGELEERLARFDTVWKALRKSPQPPLMLFLDNRAHPDHVTVRLAAPPEPDL